MQIGNSAGSAFYAMRNVAQGPQSSSADASEARAKGHDFTDMTRGQMRETMNDLIRSGKMTLDESSALVSMAGSSQLNSVSGVQDASYDAASVDFLGLLQGAISGAQSRNDQQGAQSYMDSLAALQRYQDVASQK